MKKYKYRKTFQVDGKRYSVYADTKKELMEKEIRKKIEIENDERRLDSSMTLRAWAEQCVDTYKTNQKDIPRDKYTQRMEHCILDHIGNLPLKAIKPLCGCRPGEAGQVKGSDILFLSNGLPALHIRGSKTDLADRVVPVPLEFYEHIKEIPSDEYIACTDRGPITINNRGRIWDSFCRQINIAMGCKMYRNALVPPLPLAPDLIPYCLRHEYCTELARRKVDIRTAQKLIGHSDIKLTANIYTNLNNDDIADIAAELSQGSTWVAHKKVKKGHKKASENSLIIKEKTAGILHSSGLFLMVAEGGFEPPTFGL